MGRVCCGYERQKFEIIRFSLFVLWYDVSARVFQLAIIVYIAPLRPLPMWTVSGAAVVILYICRLY